MVIFVKMVCFLSVEIDVPVHRGLKDRIRVDLRLQKCQFLEISLLKRIWRPI